MRLVSRGVATLVGTLAASLAVPAVAAPAFADDAAPPPTVGACTTTTVAPVSTIADPAGWDFSESRTAGHHEWVDGGLRVLTDDATSEAKSAGYHAADFALADAGVPAITFATTPDVAPGLQLVTDFDHDGTPDGILVGEAVYGGDWWVPGSAAQFVRDGAPEHTGGSGSSDHGTLDGWLAAFPGARVLAVGYSLGSGIHGEATITSLVAGCTRYTFGLASLGTPVVTLGAAKVGVTLAPTVTGWAAQPDTVAYTWTAGGTTVGTGATYKPVPADAGRTLTLAVSGTKDQYRPAASDAAAASASTVVATADFAGSPNPTISGTVRVGSKVTARLGTWSPAPTSVSYQWRVDGKSVAGATAATFTPRAADRGHKLTVAVTATLPGYTTLVRSSAAATVGYGVFTAAKPTISGSSQVGSKLSARLGTWSPKATSYKYQWLRSGKTVKGATRSTYKVAKADAGKSLSVRVTGSASGYTTKVVTSSGVTATVPFKTTHAATITGTTRVGSTLTAHVGAWSPKASLRYQWNRNGKPISGATRSTYTLTKADHGTKVTVSVKGTRAGYTTRTRTSKATASIGWPRGVARPRITTQPPLVAVGMGATAKFGVKATGGSLHYQWQYSVDGGTTWKAYAGKTSSTLSVTATSARSLYQYRVVVSNVVASVTSKAGVLGIVSTRTSAFDPQDPFLLDGWGATVDGSFDVGAYDDTREVVGTQVLACYEGSGSLAPSSALTVTLRIGNGTYDGAAIGRQPDDITTVGALTSGACATFTAYAVVPLTVLYSAAADSAVWALTDDTYSNGFTQYAWAQ